MENTKNIYIVIASLCASLGVALIFYLGGFSLTKGSGLDWQYKDKEIFSRLLSIPILLYHNIDGRGPFSIDYTVLREHFRLIKKNGIGVVPLHELVGRLEHPIPFKEKGVVITFDDGYFSTYTLLLPLAKEFGYPVTEFVYCDAVAHRSSRSLTWDRLRTMDRNGIDIQSHSITHADLTELSGKNDQVSRKKLFEEIYLSRRIIELYLDKKVDFFAFPYGRYDLHLAKLAADAGYKRVFSTDYGSNIISRDNFCLRRSHIKSSYSLHYFKNLIR
jgi:peptidoglycan/xylan/chitin deacetylase (PgdA/CDA1 family)